MALRTCVRTVSREYLRSSAAISGPAAPSATWCTISRSRGVSASGGESGSTARRERDPQRDDAEGDEEDAACAR